MELDVGRASGSVVEVGANEAEQHLEIIRGAGSVEETPFHLSEKIVEGVREVGGRKFVGCDGFLDAFFKRDFPPSSCFQTVKALVVTSHKDGCQREFDASCQLVCCVGFVERCGERHSRDAFDFVNVGVGIGTLYGSDMGCVTLYGNSCDRRLARVRGGRRQR